MVDLDELEAYLSLNDLFFEDRSDMTVKDARALIQELRLAREVVEAGKALDNAIGEHAEDCEREYREVLADYEQSIKANSPAGEMKEKG